jgi:hypothetical protein
MSKKIEETIFRATSAIYTNWPPKNLLAFRSWLNEKISEIPAECREEATIEITTEDDCEHPYAEIFIRYLRDEIEGSHAGGGEMG